jgi:hypothetical protein
MVVKEQVDGGVVVLDHKSTSLVLKASFSTVNDKYEHMCLDEAMGVLNMHSIGQSTDDHVSDQK